MNGGASGASARPWSSQPARFEKPAAKKSEPQPIPAAPPGPTPPPGKQPSPDAALTESFGLASPKDRQAAFLGGKVPPRRSLDK